MPVQGHPLHMQSAGDVQERLLVEREGRAFLVFREPAGMQRMVPLDPGRGMVTIGRQTSSDVALVWDPEVSRFHASIQCIGAEWTLVDDGRSRNGTLLNGHRAQGRQRLRHGDVIECGRTAIAFLDPRSEKSDTTVVNALRHLPPLSDAQRRVLTALCRPYMTSTFAVPASNAAIANELVIGLETVKTHMKELFRLFEIGALPQNQKRAELARQALARGVVVPPPQA